MKFRSALLVVLMVTVPALAMFSHHVPAGLGGASRAFVRPLVAWMGSWLAAAPASAVAAQRAEPLQEPVAGSLAPSAITVADRTAVRERLRELGATDVECRQLSGAGAADTVATCRVALDSDGQLQRVFQATGHDPLAAERGLLTQVIDWQERRPRPE